MMAINLKIGVQNATAIFLSALLFCATAAPKTCPREEAIKVEVNASLLRTWRVLYEHYKRHKQCDDGAISEGYSASVANLLAMHWNATDELIRLSNEHPDFEKFVLHHIDETMGQDQAKTIRANVSISCPVGGRDICGFIKERLAEPGLK